LAGTSYPSKPCFRLVSVLQTCTAISFLIRPSLALIGPFPKSSSRLNVRSSSAKNFSSNGYHAHKPNPASTHRGLGNLLGFRDAYHNQFHAIFHDVTYQIGMIY
jgi:hypothetical protein